MMVDYLMQMAENFYKYGKYGSFVDLLFFVCLFSGYLFIFLFIY